MSRTPRIALLGATGAMGGAVLERLAARPGAWSVLAFGGPNRSGRVDTVPFGADSLPVAAMGGVVDAEADVIVCAAPAAVGQRLAVGLADRGRLVIDVGNSTAGLRESPLWVPALGADLASEVAAAGLVRTPGAAGWLVSALAGPLAEVGLAAVVGAVLLPATRRGRLGGEELAEQLVATLQQREPPRRVFPEGLAFDVDPEDTPDDEWSEAERVAASEVNELVGLRADQVALTLGTLPLHSGLVASLHLRGVSLDEAETALRGSGSVKLLARATRVRPRAAIGREQVLVGRLRADPAGDGVHAWCAADNLGGPAAGVVDVLDRLVQAGLVGGARA